ncbi:CU044_5270 family protein [Micromonospora sp. NPDC048930]|uniref:CU044_5270 family protein n=1 Tax=Micromonospora sp. NPDC048930 TaxID=3364261 RepID=UPI00371F0078
MNELDLLATVRSVPPPTPEVEARGRARLDAVIADETARSIRPHLVRARRSGRWWQLAVSGALAGGLAAGVAVITLASPDAGVPEEAPGTVAAPADVLRDAALVAAAADLTARDDQFVHVSYLRTATTTVGGPGAPASGSPSSGSAGSGSPPAPPERAVGGDPTWLVDSRQERWESANADGDGLLRLSYSAPRPLPGHSLPPAARRFPDIEVRVADCAPDMRAPSYAYLRGLPTDPGQLRTLVDEEVRKTSTPQDLADPVRRGETTWEMLTALAQAPAAPAKLRAAVYTLMAEQTDVRLVPGATDAAGRTGVAVARELPTNGTQVQLVFDRKTYQYLGSRTITTAANPRMGYPADAVIESDALLGTEVVDAPPPAGPHAQTADCGANRPKGE